MQSALGGSVPFRPQNLGNTSSLKQLSWTLESKCTAMIPSRVTFTEE